MSHFALNLQPIQKRLAALLIVAGLLLGQAHIAYAADAPQAAPSEQRFLVQFAPELTPEARDAAIAQMGAELVGWMPQIHVAELRLPAQADGAMTAMAMPQSADGTVTFAEADTVVSATYEPSDPDWVDATMRYGLERVQAPAAWEIITGTATVVIAVVDSGVNLDHPELAGQLVAGYDFVDNDDQPYDTTGHGTHVAGVIAAGINNGLGVTGVCPNCKVMPVRVLNNANLSSWATVARGILYATDQGARIINLSLGAQLYSETLAAAVRYATERGVVVVGAAGNNGGEAPFYPAALDGVIAVSATTTADTRWERSDFGSYIDVAAPGDLIYSTYHQLDNIFGGYTYMSGTSMAAPFVAGVAGLLLSADPTLSATQVTEAMILGADDLGAPGWDAEFGFGRVNAYGALMAPLESLAHAVDKLLTATPDEAIPTGHMLFLPALQAAN
jgi:subtilisin family serine protease